MYAKFHYHAISSLENTRIGHFCPPPPTIKYATPDTPNKIELKKAERYVAEDFSSVIINYIVKNTSEM